MAKYVSKNPAPVVDAYRYTSIDDASAPAWLREAMATNKIQLCPVVGGDPELRAFDLVVNKPYGEPNTCKVGDWVAKLTYADGSVQYTFYEDKYFNDNFVVAG